MRILLGLFTLLITLVAAVAYPQPAGDFDEAAEREMVRLINESRQQAGLGPLTVDERLTRAAREHAALMAQQGTLSHQFAGEPALSKRLAATGIRFNWDGENVAFDSGTPAEAHQGLMNSPPHRANILKLNFDTVGVGVVHKGDLSYITEDFARRVQAYSPGEAETLAAQAFVALRRRSQVRPAVHGSHPALRSLACDMARAGRLDTRAALREPGARYALCFTEAQPDKLPSNAVRLASDPALKEFAVGACYGSTEQYPSGTWWVVMVFG